MLADTALRSEETDEAAARAVKEGIEERLHDGHPSAADYTRLTAELNLCAAILRSLERARGKK